MEVTVRFGDPFTARSTWKTATLDTLDLNQQEHGHLTCVYRFHPNRAFPGAPANSGSVSYEVVSVAGPRFFAEGEPVFTSDVAGWVPFQVIGSVQFGPFRWYKVVFGYAGKEKKPCWKSEFSLIQHMNGSYLSYLP